MSCEAKVVLQALSTVYTPIKDVFLWIKGRAAYVEKLEANLAKLTRELATFYSKKDNVDRSLQTYVLKEPSKEYNLLKALGESVLEKYVKFVIKYGKYCQDLPSYDVNDISSAVNVIGVLESRTPTILTRNFFKLAKMSEQVKELLDHTAGISTKMNEDNVLRDKEIDAVQVNEITEEGEQGDEEGIMGSFSSREEEHYSVVVENDSVVLKFDNESRIILIQDYRSPSKAMLDLAAQDLRELKGEESICPDSLFLFLQRNNRLTSIHSSFLDTMPDLRFLDMSDTKIRILPSSLFKLSKLKVLLLRNCICLEKLQREIKDLDKIEALDLSGTELYDLPDEIGQLTLLKSLKLSFYGPDDESEYEHLLSQLISPGFLSKLQELQALSISVHPEDHRWTEIAAQMVGDVSKLEMLTYLEFYFPEVEMFEEFIEMSASWEKEKLRNFHFIVGQNVKRIVSRVPDEVESLFNQYKRCLRYVNGDTTSPWINTMLIHVEAFYLDHHTEARSLSEFGITNLKALKFCIVRECPKIAEILDEEDGESAFPCLEYMGIYFLWELNHIWKEIRTPEPSENFKALRCLVINTCPKLRFILRGSMLCCLTKLEELTVEDCKRVEKIIEAENREVKHKGDILPGLRTLVLQYLPELVSIGNGVRLSEERVTYKCNGCPKFVLNSEPAK